MVCNGCGNPRAWKTFSIKDAEVCNECGTFSLPYVPDVFFDGKPIATLNGPDGGPKTFSSAIEKSIYLRERGLAEAGDAVHGAPYTGVKEYNPPQDRAQARHEVRKSLQWVKSLGIEKRKEMYREITQRAKNAGHV